MSIRKASISRKEPGMSIRKASISRKEPGMSIRKASVRRRETITRRKNFPPLLQPGGKRF
jgi:hypothetical protein